MLKISKKSDYGLILLSYLRGRKDYVSLSEIIKETNLPIRFMARIASTLKKYKILDSVEGKKGGYKITSQIDKMTIYDYLKIFEEDLSLTSCAKDDYCCPYEKLCSHKDFFKNKLRNLFIENMKKYKLKKII